MGRNMVFAAAACACAFACQAAGDGRTRRFLEEYAFSTNRAAEIATLRAESEQWFAYSVLNAQTEGRLGEARRLIEKWKKSKEAKNSPLLAKFRSRQAFLEAGAEPTAKQLRNIAKVLDDAGVEWRIPPRERDAASGAYPSTLDQSAVSEEAFAAAGARRRRREAPSGIDDMGKMTLAQLEDLAGKTNVSSSAKYAKEVLDRMELPTDEETARDGGRALAQVLEKRLAFARTLSPALGDVKREAVEAMVELCEKRGETKRMKELLLEYASLCDKNALRREEGMLRRRLVDLRLAGEDVGAFGGIVRSELLEKVEAEAAMLGGSAGGEGRRPRLDANEFAAVRDRVELNWAKTNPAAFGDEEEVALEIDVKNVPSMRVAIYELDAGRAVASGAGELDGATPTAERTFDYAAFPSARRHRERLKLPELRKNGMFVVECSGGGVRSRATVRKGRIDVAMRTDGSGCVFTGCDRLVVGAETFTAGDDGAVCVPFAASREEAGMKEAVAIKGAVATAVRFHRPLEDYSLSISVALPADALVAGNKATLLVRATPTVAGGARATCGILENPVLTIALADAAGREYVRTIENFALRDDAESVATFTVPDNLRTVRVELAATVKRLCDGKEKKLAAEWRRNVNSIAQETAIAQAFLRRGADGWTLELRGQAGERLAAKPVALSFVHRAFERDAGTGAMLQSDGNGCIALGRLDGIESIEAEIPGGETQKWDLRGESGASALPDALRVAPGEAIELPCGDASAAAACGERVSLTATTRGGKPVADCSAMCRIDGRMLKIAGLEAGEYVLKLPGAECETRISATPLASPGSGKRTAVESAKLENGKLTVKVANATPATRVHVLSHSTRNDTRDGQTVFDALAPAADGGGESLRASDWSRADYVSSRKIDDELRYIIARRTAGGRTGVMLDRPSMLVNPRENGETETKAKRLDGKGESMDSAVMDRSHAGLQKQNAAAPGARYRYLPSILEGGWTRRDFAGTAAELHANLRPGDDGAVSLDLPDGGAEMLEIVAFDPASGADALELAAPAGRVSSRAENNASGGTAGSKRLAPHELYRAALSIDPRDAMFTDFAFLAKWDKLDDDAKRKVYAKHASHELNFFIYMKDRAFFDAAVKPHIACKRRKEFMDRWLLGEDLAEYAKPGALQDLNALELCLLAQRMPGMRVTVAKMLDGWCAANPPDPAECDRRLGVVLGVVLSAAAAEPVEVCCADEAPEAEMCEVPAASAPPPARNSAMKSMRALASRSAPITANGAEMRRRREAKPRYRPPERAKEWIEAGWLQSGAKDNPAAAVPRSRFWRDWANAIKDGKAEGFSSANILDAFSTASSKICAIAATGADTDFRAPAANAGEIRTVSHIYEADGETEATRGFAQGETYLLETVAINPTGKRLRERVSSPLPEGAFPLGGATGALDATVELPPYGSCALERIAFYVPGAKKRAGAAATWHSVSQSGSAGDVLAWIATNDIENADLSLAGWRFADEDFAKKAYAALEKRGAFCDALWLAGLDGKGGFDAGRARRALMRRENRMRLAELLGPAFDSPLVTIDPEECGLFEHKEYWPLVNTRAHSFDGAAAAIENKGLEREWTEFLGVLAAKRAPSAGDRLLAAVFLAGQDRTAEAEAQFREALRGGAAAAAPMQTDWMKVYFTFARGDAAAAKSIAEKYAKSAMDPWRGRFAEALAQIDEAAGGKRAASSGDGAAAAAAPSLAASHAGAGVIAVKSRNIDKLVVEAYPVDAEIAFSKNPFGGTSGGAIPSVKCAWRIETESGADGETKIELPENLRRGYVVVKVSSADGRVSQTVEAAASSLDVQVVREWRQLRIFRADGRPAPGAYVKVYVRDASGGRVAFHKDGYADVRGAFDYASISAPADFQPAEYAIFVHDGKAGDTIVRVSQ